jgi:hypothetical protein
MYIPSRHFVDFHIAGFTYWDGLEVVKQLEVGTELILRGEPENPYDSEAVAIYHGDIKIGYVPKDRNSQISQLLFYGYSDLFETKISQIDPETHPEKQYRVVVKIRDKRDGRKND